MRLYPTLWAVLPVMLAVLLSTAALLRPAPGAASGLARPNPQSEDPSPTAGTPAPTYTPTQTPLPTPSCANASISQPVFLESGYVEIPVSNADAVGWELASITFNWDYAESYDAYLDGGDLFIDFAQWDDLAYLEYGTGANPVYSSSRRQITGVNNTASPFTLSGFTPHDFPAGRTYYLRFDFDNEWAGWPADLLPGDFGAHLVFENGCALALASTPRPLPSPTPTATPTQHPCSGPSSLPGPMLAPADGWDLFDINTTDPGQAVERPAAAAPAEREAFLCGSGRDIWGSADSFAYLAHPVQTGLLSFSARLTGFAPVDPWTKSGLMFRSSLEPGAANALLHTTGAYGGYFATRAQDQGLTALSAPLGPMDPPVWFRLVQTGRLVRGFTSTDGAAWSPASEATIYGLGDQSWLGLALTAHREGGFALTTYQDVAVSTPPPAFCTYQAGDFGLFVLEAEHYNRLRPAVDPASPSGEYTWTAVQEPAGFSGEGAMQAGPDLPGDVNDGLNTTGPRLDYRLNLTQTGRYYVYVRGSAGSAADPASANSILVGLDGALLTTQGQGVEFSDASTWQWRSSYDALPLFFEIDQPGLHLLNLWMRENGVRVDRVVLVHESIAGGRQLTLSEIGACGMGWAMPTPAGNPSAARRCLRRNSGWGGEGMQSKRERAQLQRPPQPASLSGSPKNGASSGRRNVVTSSTCPPATSSTWIP